MSDKKHKMSCATALAPEDVCVGDVVALLREVVEVFAWDCEVSRKTIVTHRLATLPDSWEVGEPVKVKQVCLPFVYGTTPKGEPKMFDVRQAELGRLSRAYWRQVKGDLKPSKRRKKSS